MNLRFRKHKFTKFSFLNAFILQSANRFVEILRICILFCWSGEVLMQIYIGWHRVRQNLIMCWHVTYHWCPKNCKQINVKIYLLLFSGFLMNVFLLNIIVVARQSGIAVGHNKQRQCTYMLFLFQITCVRLKNCTISLRNSVCESVRGWHDLNVGYMRLWVV